MDILKHIAALGCAALLATHSSAAGPKVVMPNPDFTKGDAIPAEAKHDWNLGATGLRGWIYTRPDSHLDALQGRTTAASRQILVTHVGEKSPADGKIAGFGQIRGREAAVQLWPWRVKRMPAIAPSTALSSSASPITIIGLLPPSSSVTGISFSAAAW